MHLNSLSEQEAAALSAFAEALRARFGDQLMDVLLFGSRARGDAKPDSDIDVLVILVTPAPNAFSDARGLGFDILLTYGVFLSIRVMSKQQWQELADMDSLFYRNLRRDGVSLLPEQV
jgi:predicted nucleotidyltransferase